MEILGRQIEAGFALETTRGTAKTTAQKWFRNVVANIIERSENSVDDSVMGVLEDSLGARVVKKFIEGDLQGIVHADAIGYLLKNLYGTSNSSVVSGSVYDHIFTLQQNIQHNSLTIFAKDGSVQQQVFNGGMVKSLEINAVVDNYIRFTAGFLARSAASNAASPSYGAEYDFIGKDITVKMATSEAGLSGATPLSLKEVNINRDQGLIQDHVLGSYTPSDIFNGKMMVEGDLTLNFADTTLKDLYLGDNARYMEIKIQGSADIGSGNNPTITILLNKVQILDWSRDGGADDVVTQKVNFRAFYNRTDSQQSEVTLRNLTTSYVGV